MRDRIFIPETRMFLYYSIVYFSSSVTLLVTNVATLNETAKRLCFWFTYNMAGFRHFVSVNEMKDGNMAVSIPVLSKWLLLCKITVKLRFI